MLIIEIIKIISIFCDKISLGSDNMIETFKKDIIAITLADIVERFNDGDVVSLQTLVENGIVKNPKFIKKYSDEALRNVKGRRAVKEYLNSNIEAYVKEKEFTSLLKIIGNAEVNKKLTVKAHRISKAAKELIEKLADVFPGETVLIEVTEAGEQKPKRSRKKKADTETTETEEVEA